MSARRKRHEEHEEHVNHERWLVSYADMMTLLMVLFIVMFAISQVDQKRFDQLKDGMAAGFGQDATPFQGSEGLMDADGLSALTPIAPDKSVAAPDKVDSHGTDFSTQAPPSTTHQPDAQAVTRAAARAAAARERADLARATKEVDSLDGLRNRIERALKQQGLQQDVAFKIDERGLTMSLVSRHIVFRANEANLSPRGQQVLQVLAPVIKTLPNHIDVDGHTNQVKVKPKYYPTDWELSAARAVTVLRYLAEDEGVPAKRMAAVAFGHEKPLVKPSDPDAAALNKRVDLVVVSNAPERARRLFGKVAAEHDHHRRT